MSHNWRSYRKKTKQTGDNKSILQFFNKASTEQAGSSQSDQSLTEEDMDAIVDLFKSKKNRDMPL